MSESAHQHSSHSNWREWLPTLELACAVLAGVLWYTQGGAVWYTGDWPGPWPLLLLALMWGLRWLYAGFSLKPSVFTLPLTLFLISAGISLWAAHDPALAWAKFWLIIGAMGLYQALAHQPTLKHIYMALACWGTFGIVLTSYFLLTNDWTAYMAKFPPLAALGEGIAARLPSLASRRFNPNVVGGMLALILPFYVPLIALPKISRGRDGINIFGKLQQRVLPVVWAVGSGISLMGWLVTTSRGAWIAILTAAVLWGSWRALGWWGRRTGRHEEAIWRARLWGMGGLLAGGALLATLAAYLILARSLPGVGALTNRLSLLRDSALLAKDTPFTGIGLGLFDMHFSIYTLLIHVGYIVDSHNFLMDVLIEQGVLGVIGYLGLVSACLTLGLRRLRCAPREVAWIIEAGLASLVVILAHGLVDDALYGSRGLLLLFVPFGLVLAAGKISIQGEGKSDSRNLRDLRNGTQLRRSNLHWAIAAGLTGIALVGIINRHLVLGAWYANLGAIAQARVELDVYDQWHFDDPTMDDVRQRENLAAALTWFDRALEVDPANVTARQRLAAIELSRGQYADALANMQAAWDEGHRDSVTRLLYGDALVAHGRVAEAVTVIRGLRWAKPRLLGQAWSRYQIHGDEIRAAYARQAAQ